MTFLQRLYRNFPWLIGLLLALVLIQPYAWAQSIETWVSPRQQEGNGSWISDRAGLINWQTEQHLNRRINKLVGRTSAEMAIATLPQLDDGQSSHTFALKLFNAWGIGKRNSNNGVLLFISQGDRRIEIITGTGLSNVLPNAEVSHLIQQEIVPAFQKYDYATGVIQGVNEIAQHLEARLPNTIFPKWLPGIIVWIPWIITMGGVGLAIISTIRILAPSFTAVTVPVPTQGINTNTFAGSSDTLTNYPWPSLVTKVFRPPVSQWEEHLSELFGYLLLSGWISGIGLIYGFWQFVLMHPEAELWQGDVVAWVILGGASSGWFLWGMLIASRFITHDWPWFVIPLALVTAALMVGIGGLLVYGMTVAWWLPVIGLMILVGLLGGTAWIILIQSHLHFQQRRDYHSDRTGNSIQELTAQELETVLYPEEILAQSMGKLEFRGWRDVELTTPVIREQVYLVRRSVPNANVCAHCKSYAVDISEQTVERTIETTKKIDRKRKETITSVKTVKQTVHTCHSCGCVFTYDQREPRASSNNSGSSDDSYSDFGTPFSSSNSDYSSGSDNYSSNDYGNSSSSDFGGGSSDGGGAGSDW